MDFGGHSEYYAASHLFVASSGICFVCFEPIKDADEKLLNEVYYSNVGTYVDLISRIACQTGIEPKIILVATKIDKMDEKETYKLQFVLDQVKIQLKGLDKIFSKTQRVFLIDKVIETTSKNAKIEDMVDLYNKLVSLYSSPDLQTRQDIPQSWYRLLKILRQKNSGSISTQEVSEEFAKVKNETDGKVNISLKSLQNLEILQIIIKTMLQEVKIKEKANRFANKKNIPIKKALISKRESHHDRNDTDIGSIDHHEDSNLEYHDTVKIDTNSNIRHHKPEVLDNVSMPLLQNRYEDFMGENMKVEESIALVLSFFTGIGEVLWFQMIEALKNIVIPIPMELIKALRTVLNHKVLQFFRNDADRSTRQDLEEKGILRFKDLKVIYQKSADQEHQTTTFSEEQIWNFLIQLKLACRLDESEVIKDESRIFIPCLISDKREKNIKNEEEKMEKESNSICVEYSMDISKQGLDLYYDVIYNLANSFIFKENLCGEIIEAFSQKIENRTLGNVGGLYGSLQWTERDIRNPEDFTFLLLDYDTDFNFSKDDEQFVHAIHKGVRIHLRRDKGDLTSGIIEILYELDTLITKVLPSASRRLICKECNGKYKGHFLLDEDLCPNLHGHCNGRGSRHRITENLKDLFERTQKKRTFCLKKLMKRPKESLGLEDFKTSSIREKMLDSKMGIGDQIWIYHDKTTNPWYNPLPILNKYAHCVIYVGYTNGVHEVVHVTLDTTRRALRSRASIAKQDVEKVIKPDDQVFLGHRIEGSQFSGNIRKKIVERALACVDPNIIFNYDHKSNCETFCNMIVFGINHSTQSDDTICCIKCCFNCCNNMKCLCRSKNSLDFKTKIEKRLTERGLIEKIVI